MTDALVTEKLASPAWFRELRGTLGVNSQFVLEGNVYDRYLLPSEDGGEHTVPDLLAAVWEALGADGYEALLLVDPSESLRVYPATPEATAAVSELLGRGLDGAAPPTLESLAEDLGRVVHGRRQVAVVVERAGRLAPDPTHLTPEQHAFFTAAERLALGARRLPRGPSRGVGLFNAVIWIAERDRQLPDFLVAHSDHVRSIAIPLPDYGQRLACARRLLASLEGFEELEAHEREQHVDRFTRQTEGMTLAALFSILYMAIELAPEAGGVRAIEDAARAYRVGIVDNPWRASYLRERLTTAEETVGQRVLGQRDAIRKSLDIMIRSATGLTGAHGSQSGTRPRGVLFFAGPTGVGKTELAKQLTELVFGDERAYVRFDMSEFSAEHNAARLIGAPPGYAGYDAGGELTNALRERPFSLILFDEIEKAHGRILDKFLQILEDGRLTDGRGATVFFSEAIIVFTSNLGIWVEDAESGERVANVTPAMDRAEAETRILEAIKRHFTSVLGRPELLNRLGDNIVVFDFIDRDTGERILDLLLTNVARQVEREHRATLVVEPEARRTLADEALADPSNGGRGIGSVVENALVNPLARHLFARDVAAGDELRVTAIRRSGRTFEVDLA